MEPSHITVSDPLLETVSYQSGDVNADGILNLDETWSYTGDYTVTSDDVTNQTITGILTAKGYNADGDITQILSLTYAVGVSSAKALPPEEFTISFTSSKDVSSVSEEGDVINYSLEILNDCNHTFEYYSMVGSTTMLTYFSGDDNVNNEIDRFENWIFKGSYTLTESDIATNGGGDGVIENDIELIVTNECDAVTSGLIELDVAITAPTTIPAPTGNATQYFCDAESLTLADAAVFNTAGYNDIIWHDTADQTGSAIDSNTEVMSGDTYYASRNRSYCRSIRSDF
jgi:hypothetical protein